MIETDPDLSLHRVFAAFTKVDPHPPLYFILIHYWFQVVGYNDYTARLFSAIAGTLAIPVVYLVGKELYSRSAGLIAAAFSGFNYFLIEYSQEARNYMLVCVLTCLSFLSLIRMLRSNSMKHALLYAFATLALIYLHYYGFVVLASHMLIAAIFAPLAESRKKHILHFGLAYAIIAILYLPWVPQLLQLSARPSFWIKKPDADFFVTFFWDYFGKDAFTVYLFVLLLIIFLIGIVRFERDEKQNRSILENRYLFSLLILSIWFFATYLIPYARSLTSVPLLFNRYTIVTLPAILLAAAIGVDMFPRSSLKIFTVVLVIVLSMIHLFLYKRYYVAPMKTQWREMSSFVVKNNDKKVPLISDRAWHLQYYFRKAKFHPKFIRQKSIPELNDFWVVTGPGGKPLAQKDQAVVARYFKEQKSFHGIGTWAVLYSRIRIPLSVMEGNISPDGFHSLSNGRLHTKTIHLKPGKYSVDIFGYGKNLDGIFPKLKLSANQNSFAEFTLSEKKDYRFEYNPVDENDVVFSLELLNPENVAGEGRAAFVQYFDLEVP